MSFNVDLKADVNKLIENFSGRGIGISFFRRKYMTLTFYSAACGKEAQRFTCKEYKGQIHPVYIRINFRYIIIEEPEQLETGEVFYLEFKYPYSRKDFLISAGMLCPSKNKHLIRKRP